MSVRFESVLPHPQRQVFTWHERPGAFTRLSPPWHPTKIISEADSLDGGRGVIRLPLGLRWVAQHSHYDPPHQFVDDLTSLPLPWHHEHRFEAISPNETRMIDTLKTPVPTRFVRKMFRYRHTQLRDDLAAQEVLSRFESGSLKVAITGSSGLVGSALSAYLGTAGHQVIRLVRYPTNHPLERQWEPLDPDPAIFEGVDAVVHLAGASIAGRFCQHHKAQIRESRIEPTYRLAQAVAAAGDAKVLVTASAVGLYGFDEGPLPLDESMGMGQGFLAQVVADWEAAAEPAESAGLRVVKVRTGLALSPKGGLLRLLYPLFLAGGGGRLGDGSSWMSWIDLDDLTDIYAHALVDENLEGPVNAVAPNPVDNREFTKVLARVVRRPAIAHVPRPVLSLVAGRETVQEIVCASQLVVPEVLLDNGFAFRRPSLEASLRHQLGRF